VLLSGITKVYLSGYVTLATNAHDNHKAHASC